MHARFLKLLEGPASFNALVLARVAHKYHTVSLAKPLQKLVHLSGTREAGFIDDEEVCLPVIAGVRAGKKMLEGVSADLCFLELVSGARCGGKSLDPKTLLFGRFPNRRQRSRLPCASGSLQADDLIAGLQNVFSGLALSG